MDELEVIKQIVETGEVSFGYRSVSKKGDKAKLLIIAENCPQKIKESVSKVGKPVYTYSGTSLDLGELCGKPFPIAAMAVISPGRADITPLLRGAKN